MGSIKDKFEKPFRIKCIKLSEYKETQQNQSLQCFCPTQKRIYPIYDEAASQNNLFTYVFLIPLCFSFTKILP